MTQEAPHIEAFTANWIESYQFHPVEEAGLVTLLEKTTYLTPEEQSHFWESMILAMYVHKNQSRNTGEPYSTHLIEVGLILTDLRLGVNQLIAGVLHDTVEDCSNGDREEFIAALRGRFGDRVVEPVLMVTTLQDVRKKYELSGDQEAWIAQQFALLGKVPDPSLSPKQQVDELYRLQFLHIAIDARWGSVNSDSLTEHEQDVITALILKLADRLHNMRTISGLTPENQIKNAKETLEIHVKLAKRLGLWEISDELENISYGILNPKNNEALAKMQEVRAAIQEKKPTVEVVSDLLSEVLNDNHMQKRIIVPNAASMCANTTPFVILDLGIDPLRGKQAGKFSGVKRVLDILVPALRNEYLNKKSIWFPDIPAIMKLLRKGTLNTVTITVPYAHTDLPGVTQLRINVMTNETFAEETHSVHHAVSWDAFHEGKDSDDFMLSIKKWDHIQGYFQQYKSMFRRIFATFTSAEILLALTQRIPVGKILVIGSPRGKPQVPWLMDRGTTVGDYMRSIVGLQHKESYKIMINGLPVSDESFVLMPFDKITIS